MPPLPSAAGRLQSLAQCGNFGFQADPCLQFVDFPAGGVAGSGLPRRRFSLKRCIQRFSREPEQAGQFDYQRVAGAGGKFFEKARFAKCRQTGAGVRS